MFEYRAPLFNPGPLRKDILENMRDLALAEQNVRYSAYSDGILSGCKLFEENMRIGVENGLVKYSGRVYVLQQRESVSYKATDSWTVLKISFSGDEGTRDYALFRGELILDENTNILPNEMELGRFKLKQGSRLRTIYQDFRDMGTEYDTCNLVNVPFAGIDESTLSPVITQAFAREAYPHIDNYHDAAFCSACLCTGEALKREYIIHYVSTRCGFEYKPLSNIEIHHYLAYILDVIKGTTDQIRPGTEKRGIMLV